MLPQTWGRVLQSLRDEPEMGFGLPEMEFADGSRYELGNPDMTDVDWLRIYTAELRTRGATESTWSHTFLNTLDPEQREFLRRELGDSRCAGFWPSPETIGAEDYRICKWHNDRGMIGYSGPMIGVFRLMARMGEETLRTSQAPNVLVSGETGTGKELIAERLHELAGREGHFEAINCATIPYQTSASILFGHEKGSFTGADRTVKGIFERCDGGTVHLDEISKMDKQDYPRLLRVLREGKVRRLGGDREFDVDVLVVAATNEDLGELVAKGDFPRDLYHRLLSRQIHMPRLDQRIDDVPRLVYHLLQRHRDSPLYEYRFAFAALCEDFVREIGWNVATLKDAVDMVAAESYPLERIWEPAQKGDVVRRKIQALEEAVAWRLRNDKELKLPLSLPEAAAGLKWNGKRGKSKRYLYDGAWREPVQVLVEDGKIWTDRAT